MKAQIASLLGVGLTLLPMSAFAASAVTIVQGGALPVSNQMSQMSCPSLSRSLSRGATGPDVQSLQRYLISGNFLAAGSDSGFYGALTEAAVQRFQAAQKIVSSGSPATTGWGAVGARTRAAIAGQCGGVSKPTSCPIAPPPATTCPTKWQANTDANGCTTSYNCSIPLPGTGSTVQTSPAFTGSPLFGTVPLAVSFVTKISSPTSFAGGSYQIDYGDASFENIAGCSLSGVCSLDSGTHMHTFATPGTYYPRLLYINRAACPAGTAVCAEKQEVVGTLTVTGR